MKDSNILGDPEVCMHVQGCETAQERKETVEGPSLSILADFGDKQWILRLIISCLKFEVYRHIKIPLVKSRKLNGSRHLRSSSDPSVADHQFILTHGGNLRKPGLKMKARTIKKKKKATNRKWLWEGPVPGFCKLRM